MSWGGVRVGAGRPKTGRKKVVLYITAQEEEKIKKYLKTLRENIEKEKIENEMVKYVVYFKYATFDYK